MSVSSSSPTLLGYAVGPDGYDEAVAPSGETRAAWRTLWDEIASMSPVDVARLQRQADRLVESEGASYLFHDFDDDTSRPWRLDSLPLIIGGSEWSGIERGVGQRVRILDRMIADFYGEQQLLRTRAVPPAAVFGAPGFLLAAQHTHPPQARWLTVYAADLVRLASGEWRVLRDVTDAPSGAGYALVNRHISAQLLPDVVRDLAPLSLAPFLTDFRSALDATAPDDRASPRAVVLSPGLGHASYFEHSYLAANLGYHLAEPGDLVVRSGKVWLRALSGLEPVDVLLRRIDGNVADPLESSRGATGVPGLARAARERFVGLANALGSGVVGSMGLLPYVAKAAEAFGEDLLVPEIRTLWCGSPDDRDEVVADHRRFVLHDAFGIGPSGTRTLRSLDDSGRQGGTVFGSQLDDASWTAWRTLIETEPHRVIGQEKVSFATAPVLTPNGVDPATVVLRVLAVVGRNGITVMPGGLARVVDPMIPIVSQTSGFAKDVWVLDDRPDRPLPIATRAVRSMPQVDLRESLPTRVAEAMYWVGRSAERSEALVRATAAALADLEGDSTLLTAFDGGWRVPVVAALGSLTDARHVGAAPIAPSELTLTAEAEFRTAVAAALVGPNGFASSLRSLSRAASSARQFVSATTWRVLGQLEYERIQLDRDVETGHDPGVRRHVDSVIVHLSSLSGLFTESTVRGPAWRFLEIGRRVERAATLLSMLETVVSPAPSQLRGRLFDYVLAANESLVAYRRRYRSDAVLDALVDLLVLDDQNPRAIAFQLDQLRTQIALLPSKDGSQLLATTIDEVGAALLDVAWLPADADQPGSDGRRETIDRFVAAARAPLFAFADQLNHVYFNDPARMRQRVGGA